MQNQNIETVREKLFSTKPSSEKMNDEIRISIDRIREARLRRLRPSEFKDEDEPITDPIENIREERKQRQRISFETSEILGHTKSLIEEIDEYIRQVNI